MSGSARQQILRGNNPREHVFGPFPGVGNVHRPYVRNTHLEKIGLEVSAHRCSSYADHQGGKRIEATRVTGGLRDGVAVSAGRSFEGRSGHRCEPTSQATRFETHPDQTCEPKHDSDTDMLNLLGGVRVTWMCAKTFHPRIGYAVQEDHQRLDKFCGDMLAGGGTVPRPTQLGE